MLMFSAVSAFERTAAIKTAVELELFTVIGGGAHTAEEIAAATQCSLRGARMLCDYLVVEGFLTKEGPNYALTASSAMFLDKKSRAYLGGMVAFLTSETMVNAFGGLTKAVRQGGTALGHHGTMDFEHPVWIDFAHGMGAMMMPAAMAIPKILAAEEKPVRKVLDLAAGHGMFGICVAQMFPEAEVVAVDWPEVLNVAAQNAERAGVSDRWHRKPGSAFEIDFGDGYDLVLVTNFYHHFNPDVCTGLAKKIHHSLAEGGRKVTLEFCPYNDRVTPPGPAQFALVMLASTAEGDAYTVEELEGMFRSAGYSHTEAHRLPNEMQTVLVSYR